MLYSEQRNCKEIIKLSRNKLHKKGFLVPYYDFPSLVSPSLVY